MAYFGLIAYTTFLYIRPQDIFPLLYSFPIMGITVGLTIIASLFTQGFWKRPLIYSLQDKFMILFLIALILPHIFQTYLDGAINSFTDFSKIIIIYLLINRLVDTPAKLKGYIIVLVVLTILLAVQGLQQHYTGFGWGGQIPFLQGEGGGFVRSRVIEPEKIEQYEKFRMQEGILMRITGTGIFQDPNDLALALVIAVPFIVHGILKGRPLLFKLLCLFFLLLIINAIYLTNSRGGMITLGIIFLIFFANRFGLKKGIIVGFLAVSFMFFFAPSRTQSIDMEESGTRTVRWSEGLQVFKSAPLFGVGMNMYEEYQSQTAHNTFLLALAETGMFGTFMIIGLFYTTYKRLRAIEKSPANEDLKTEANLLNITIIGFVVGSFFLSRLYIPVPYILIALAVAIANMIDKKDIETGFTFKDARNIFAIMFFLIASFYLFGRFYWARMG